MRARSEQFKESIKLFGRELDVVINYSLNDEFYEISNEDLSEVSLHYDGALLKSIMKQLDITSYVDVPVGTELTNVQVGVKTRYDEVDNYRSNYDYVNLGTYIVYSSEKQEDTNEYKLVCYDKMLTSMKPYESPSIVYPTTIRDYANALSLKLGLTFKNAGDTFPNYDKVVSKELFLDENGNDIGYTFRDVLDQLAEVTASSICIKEDTNELELRYATDTEDTINEGYLKDANVNFQKKFGPINSIVLSRAGGSDNIYLKDDESIEENGLCEIKISENQFMNFNDRNEYLPDILDTLDGIEFYLNDFESTGIIYYEPCDLYGITIGETTYNCIMLNDDINVSQGLVENIYTDIPDGTETDYKKADKTDQRINKANLIVDKQGKQIEGLITEVGEHDARLTQLTINIDNIQNLFQITGGSNLIKNSQLLLPDDFWTFTDKEGSSQSYHTPLGEGYNGSLIGQTVAVANIVLRDCTATTKDINITNLKMSVPHVLNYYISQDKQTTSIVTLTAKNTGEVIYTDTVTTTTNEVSMKNKSISFITTDTEYILSIESSSASTGYTTIYDLMLNTGDKKSWEPSVSEVYSTILKMSQLGMQVFSSGSNILTLITSDGFQVREATQSGSGEINVGRIISEFDRDGLTTETAEMKKLIIGKYVQTEMTLSNVLHHVEYFQS